MNTDLIRIRSQSPASHLSGVLLDGLLPEDDGLELGEIHTDLLAELEEVEGGAVRGIERGRVAGQNHRHLLLE